MKARKDFKAEAKVFKALAHPTRLLLIGELAARGRCVQELVALAGANFSTVSRHLALLKEIGAVKDERRGQQVFYSLGLPCVGKSIDCASKMVRKNLELKVAALGGSSDVGIPKKRKAKPKN
jgi:ArsR family transcriptional regulator